MEMDDDVEIEINAAIANLNDLADRLLISGRDDPNRITKPMASNRLEVLAKSLQDIVDKCRNGIEDEELY